MPQFLWDLVAFYWPLHWVYCIHVMNGLVISHARLYLRLLLTIYLQFDRGNGGGTDKACTNMFPGDPIWRVGVKMLDERTGIMSPFGRITPQVASKS